jgi:hypothetical protein
MGRRARGNRKTSQPGFEEVVKVFVSLPEEDGGRDPRGPGKEAGMRKGVWYGLLTGLALLLAACGGQPPPSLTLAPQPDLTLVGISPQNPAVVQGETVTLTLTFTSQNGFQGQVSSSVLEGGQPVSWLSPNAVQRNLNVPRGQQVQETLEVQVDPDAPTGSQNLTVRAAYGNQVTERDLTLTVSAGDGDGGEGGDGDGGEGGDGDGGEGGDGRSGATPSFTISLDPTSLTVPQGASGTTQLTLTPQNGFTGGVRLALVAGQDRVPRGLTLSPRSVRVSGTSPVNQSLTLSARRTTPPGTYRLKVRATSRRLTREADLTVEIGAASTDNLRILRAEWGQTVLKQNLRLVAGKEALLRVHLVAAPSALSLSQPLAGAVYQGSAFVGNLSFTCPNPIPTTTAQGALSTTCNATLPWNWVASGLRVELRADPNNQVAETNESDNALTLSPSVGAGTVLYLTVVPVVHQWQLPSTPTFAPTLRGIWPLQSIAFNTRAPYTFFGVLGPEDGDAWSRLLTQLAVLRQADGSERYYYGFVRVSYTSGIAGIGFVGYPVAVGWDYSQSAPAVMAHELGHNFGRRHAPCGVSGDPDYPVPDGRIDTWGYDLASGALKDPSQYYDLMSYCNPQWVSNYNYEAVQRFLENNPPSPLSLSEEGLLFSGRIRGDEVVFDPPLRLAVAPVGKPSPYRILADGVESPAYVLEDSEGVLHFQAKLPLGSWNRLALYRDGVLLKEVVAPLMFQAEPNVDLKEVGGFVEVRWTGYPYLSLAHLAVDGGRTTLGLFAQGGEARFPIQGLPRGGQFEVQLSDGLNVQVLLFPR